MPSTQPEPRDERDGRKPADDDRGERRSERRSERHSDQPEPAVSKRPPGRLPKR